MIDTTDRIHNAASFGRLGFRSGSLVNRIQRSNDKPNPLLRTLHANCFPFISSNKVWLFMLAIRHLKPNRTLYRS